MGHSLEGMLVNPPKVPTRRSFVQLVIYPGGVRYWHVRPACQARWVLQISRDKNRPWNLLLSKKIIFFDGAGNFVKLVFLNNCIQSTIASVFRSIACVASKTKPFCKQASFLSKCTPCSGGGHFRPPWDGGQVLGCAMAPPHPMPEPKNGDFQWKLDWSASTGIQKQTLPPALEACFQEASGATQEGGFFRQ